MARTVKKNTEVKEEKDLSSFSKQELVRELDKRKALEYKKTYDESEKQRQYITDHKYLLLEIAKHVNNEKVIDMLENDDFYCGLIDFDFDMRLNEYPDYFYENAQYGKFVWEKYEKKG